MTKKKVLAVAGALGIAALVLSAGTLAYFTDTDKETNTFTIGNVKIDLIESKFHRVNAGETTAGRLSWDTSIEGYAMNGTAGSAPADAHGWAGAYYTDAQILADSQTYRSDYLANAGQNLVPGANVMKAPYVINKGSVPAYVRVRVLVPKELDDKIVSSSMYTGSAYSTGATTRPDVTTVTRSEGAATITYTQYAFTYLDALAPEQMTFWNVWGDIMLDSDLDNDDIQEMIDGGFLTRDGKFSVLVEADGIQAAGFDSATAAFTAFDQQNNS